MRIAMFTDTYSPQVNGVVTVINTLREGLERIGHEVFIYTVSHPDAEKDDRVFRLKSFKFPKEPQHRVSMFPDPRIFSKAKKQNIEIVHTHSPFTLGHLGVMVAKFLDVPVVHTFHTYYEEYRHYLGPFKVFITDSVLRVVGRYFCNLHDVVVAPSWKMKNVIDSYSPKVPVVVIPNGIKLDNFSRDFTEEEKRAFRDRFSIDSSDKVVVFVGRMGKEKSVDKLIENFHKLRKRMDGVKLLLVGDGPDRKKLESMASDLGLKEEVIFTGYLDWPDEVALAYHVSDLFVSASHTEVHPVTFIEAIASGLPVVAYDDPSLKGVVVQNENGLLFKNKDDLHVGMEKILKDEETRKKFSEKSVEISRNFSEDLFVKRMLDLYEDLRSSQGRALRE